MDTIENIRKAAKEGTQSDSTAVQKVDPSKEVPATFEAPKLNPQIDRNKSLTEQAKDIVGVMATQKAIEDEGLVDDVTGLKKEELKAGATASLKKEQASSKQAEVELQKSNYGVYEGVATYAGIKRPLPRVMQNVLFTLLAIVQIIILIVVGIPTSIINIVADCIDSIVLKLSNIAKSARVLVLSLLSLGAIVLVIYIGYELLVKFGVI